MRMNKTIPVLLTLSLIFVVLIVVLKNQPTVSESTVTDTPASEMSPSITKPEPANESIPTPETEKAPTGEGLVDPVVVREELFEISEADMTPFLHTEIAAKWKKELGYTDSEFIQAQRDLRARGFSEDKVNDPGVIMRHLPPRHTGRIRVSEIIVPEFVAAGETIPFTLKGIKPSPSYSFTHFDILVQGKTIRINAIGNSDGDNEAGLGGPVSLNGTLDPLMPGVYRVVVPELGPKGYFRIVVK